jgi:hypothetical protein
MVCDDGTRYGLNSDGSLVSRYHASHPEAGMTGGPWPTTSIAMAEWEWVDPELHRTCYFFAGVTRSSVPSGNCHPTSDNSADAAAEPPAVAPPPANVAGGAPPSEDAPDTLTASQRADILSAIDRANAAWATASQSLNTSDLNGAVAGRELTDDLAELDKLRRLEQTRKNINTAFAVTNVTLDAPGHAIVRTHETWYAETYDATSGRRLQRTPPATYDETYTVEYLSGGWIVTTNDI